MMSVVLSLTACGALDTSDGMGKPLIFSDTDGQLVNAYFMAQAGGGNPKVVGLVRIDKSGLNQELEIVRMNSDLSIAVSDNQGKDKAVNLSALSNAKGFKIYTFSRNAGTIEVGQVTAANDICKDFRKHGVNVEIADNLYTNPMNGKMMVYRSAGVLAANSKADKIKRNEFDDRFAGSLSEAQKKSLQAARSNMAEITRTHYERLRELLNQGICR